MSGILNTSGIVIFQGHCKTAVIRNKSAITTGSMSINLIKYHTTCLVIQYFAGSFKQFPQTFQVNNGNTEFPGPVQLGTRLVSGDQIIRPAAYTAADPASGLPD